MRRLLAACATLLCASGATPAAAQVAGQFGVATPIAVNAHVFGIAAGAARQQFVGLASLRLSFYPGIDFGFQGGLHHFGGSADSRNAIELGADVRTLVVRRAAGAPADVSLGGAISVASADRYNVLSVGPTVAASRTHALHGGAEISPYGGVALLYWRSDVGSENTTGVTLPIRLGLDYRPNADVHLLFEFQAPIGDPVSDNPKLMLGANFPF